MFLQSLGPRSVSLIALCALFATIGSGCVSPGSDEFTKPVASNPAASEPVVLNGAGGKIANPAARVEVKAEPSPGATAFAAAKADPVASPAAGPVLSATPVPPKPETPAVAAVASDPAADQTGGKNADGYPNINTPPREPASRLMPEDERARVISELEALRKKGGSATADTEVAKKGSGKAKGGVKCADGTMATSDAGCKTSDQ